MGTGPASPGHSGPDTAGPSAAGALPRVSWVRAARHRGRRRRIRGPSVARLVAVQAVRAAPPPSRQALRRARVGGPVGGPRAPPEHARARPCSPDSPARAAAGMLVGGAGHGGRRRARGRATHGRRPWADTQAAAAGVLGTGVHPLRALSTRKFPRRFGLTESFRLACPSPRGPRFGSCPRPWRPGPTPCPAASPQAAYRPRRLERGPGTLQGLPHPSRQRMAGTAGCGHGVGASPRRRVLRGPVLALRARRPLRAAAQGQRAARASGCDCGAAEPARGAGAHARRGMRARLLGETRWRWAPRGPQGTGTLAVDGRAPPEAVPDGRHRATAPVSM